jgi:hypothetical protein
LIIPTRGRFRHTAVVDLGFGVAVGLAGLCRNYAGELRRSGLIDAAVRGALLTDLALDGRISSTSHAVSIDTTPTGFAPADRLLAAIVASPTQTLEWWLRQGKLDQRDLAEHLVAVGMWRQLPRTPVHRRPRYEVAGDPMNQQAAHQRVRVHKVFLGGQCDAPTACLSALALVTGLMEDRPAQRPRDDLLDRCEPAMWITRTVVDYVINTRAVLASSPAR